MQYCKIIMGSAMLAALAAAPARAARTSAGGGTGRTWYLVYRRMPIACRHTFDPGKRARHAGDVRCHERDSTATSGKAFLGLPVQQIHCGEGGYFRLGEFSSTGTTPRRARCTAVTRTR